MFHILQGNPDFELGQRDAAEEGDLEKIRIMYNCDQLSNVSKESQANNSVETMHEMNVTKTQLII